MESPCALCLGKVGSLYVIPFNRSRGGCYGSKALRGRKHVSWRGRRTYLYLVESRQLSLLALTPQIGPLQLLTGKPPQNHPHASRLPLGIPISPFPGQRVASETGSYLVQHPNMGPAALIAPREGFFIDFDGDITCEEGTYGSFRA